MKIAIITSSFYPVIDGVTIAVFNRIEHLSKLGHEVVLFCPDYSAIEYIYPDWQQYTGKILPGVEVISLPSTESIGLDFERDVTQNSYKFIVKKLAVFQPDIIHIDEAERLGICLLKKPGIEFARQYNIPCVAFFHTNYLEYLDDYFSLPLGLNGFVKGVLNLIFTNIYNAYDLTLVSSRVTFDKLAARGIKNLHHAELLGFNIAKFQPVTKTPDFFTRNYNIENIKSKIKLIFVGRLTPDKGWNFAIDALSKLPREILSQIAFIIVGDGNLKDRITQELTELIPNVYLLGRVPPNAISSLLINSDIFVTNSEKETRGLAVIEARAAGIPIIAPDAGGISDTVRDCHNGLLYEPHNKEDFIAKLVLLISDSNLRHQLGINNKARKSLLSWQQATDNLIDIWQAEINKKTSNHDR